MLKHKPLPPSTETCAITLDRPKTAALCFDRVYSSHLAKTPVDIQPGYVRAGKLEVWGTAARVLGLSQDPDSLARDISNNAIPTMKGLRKHGFLPIPYFSNANQLHRTYRKKEKKALGLLIDNLLTVDEEGLEWPQVEDFRRDIPAREDYRRLLYWFDTTFEGKDVEEIKDYLLGSYDKYTTAIKKHGLPARSGGIESMHYQIVSIATLAGILAAVGLPLLSGGAAIGGLLVSIRNELLNSSAYTGLRSELGFIHRINSLSTPKTK